MSSPDSDSPAPLSTGQDAQRNSSSHPSDSASSSTTQVPEESQPNARVSLPLTPTPPFQADHQNQRTNLFSTAPLAGAKNSVSAESQEAVAEVNLHFIGTSSQRPTTADRDHFYWYFQHVAEIALWYAFRGLTEQGTETINRTMSMTLLL